ncbi:MAG TPA: ATP synthase F1 subunit delta [Candidatus Omnitrophota bacterium]|nr:ATP synthase F1 subunit delta [Candidatus Omnitrophota bacterium]HPD85439.1 ATP synthase F1 subunit delta [Candidatus Omnitrophota bacterium]HRZ04060.1 ATP synthase F1 subunit delta [Candidatus Omnitrophota bacterium]
MREAIIAKRYAEGLLSYLNETIGVEKGIFEFEKMAGIIENNPGIRKLLAGWQITAQEKQALSDNIFKEGFSEEIRRFLKLLINKKRLTYAAAIARYARAIYSQDKEAEAVVQTAFPLDDKFIEAIKEKLSKKLNKKINLRMELSPALIGGVRIVIGNSHLDGSIQRTLADLREQLTAIRIS